MNTSEQIEQQIEILNAAKQGFPIQATPKIGHGERPGPESRRWFAHIGSEFNFRGCWYQVAPLVQPPAPLAPDGWEIDGLACEFKAGETALNAGGIPWTFPVGSKVVPHGVMPQNCTDPRHESYRWKLKRAQKWPRYFTRSENRSFANGVAYFRAESRDSWWYVIYEDGTERREAFCWDTLNSWLRGGHWIELSSREEAEKCRRVAKPVEKTAEKPTPADRKAGGVCPKCHRVHVLDDYCHVLCGDCYMEWLARQPKREHRHDFDDDFDGVPDYAYGDPDFDVEGFRSAPKDEKAPVILPLLKDSAVTTEEEMANAAMPF